MTDRLAKLFPDWSAWREFWSTLEFGRELEGLTGFGTVSYTHLTLPTIYSV